MFTKALKLSPDVVSRFVGGELEWLHKDHPIRAMIKQIDVDSGCLGVTTGETIGVNPEAELKINRYRLAAHWTGERLLFSGAKVIKVTNDFIEMTVNGTERLILFAKDNAQLILPRLHELRPA
ncbi:MAG: hypothetical protein NUV54_02275 [Candidatus Taylorbacteria bacterium]|nr:hypothetical protein [Candidatus Taylorbacteria bacterium]